MSGLASETVGQGGVSSPPLSRQVAIRAAEWFVLLQSSDATAADACACEAWRAQSPEHERAWQRAMQISRLAGSVPSALGAPTLRRPEHSVKRRDAARVLAVLIVAAPAGWLAWRAAPWQSWGANHTTAVGERREWRLSDGTRIVLDTDSAVQIRFDAQQRVIALRSGAIFVETAPDVQVPPRPLLVTTENGTARAIGTRFAVRQHAERSEVAVLQGAVEVRARQSAAVQRLRQGEQAAFDGTAIAPVQSAPVGAGQWAAGVMAVHDMRLDDFVAELSRYRRGVLRCDASVAQLRVTGAFQLSDTDAVLQNLVHLLPVQVHYRTRYWVTVVAPIG